MSLLRHPGSIRPRGEAATIASRAGAADCERAQSGIGVQAGRYERRRASLPGVDGRADGWSSGGSGGELGVLEAAVAVPLARVRPEGRPRRVARTEAAKPGLESGESAMEVDRLGDIVGLEGAGASSIPSPAVSCALVSVADHIRTWMTVDPFLVYGLQAVASPLQELGLTP